jgi:peptidoglycan/xylan/chitin deacetylase (PgdA/CDA1 family)
VRIALKIDVDTLQGTRHGVPALARMCRQHGARATFLFSLGPDHTGRAIKRVFRPGFLTKVSRTSVLEHYGLLTLLYGTLLPGPDIGRRCADILRDIAAQGFEVGVHCYDHASWQDDLARKGDAFARQQMRLAAERFCAIFGFAPRVHGAAGWQMNDAALLCEDELGFTVASDTRGRAPFRPRVGTTTLRCIQLPTTLPTLDELMGRDDEAGRDPVAHLLRQTAMPSGDHVYTLHAELEGRKLAPWFDRLLAGWRGQGYEFVTLGDLAASLDADSLPVREVAAGTVPGRSGTLAVEAER